MTREECLKKAQECVMGQREQDYGSPEDNFRKIANLWNAYLGFDNISDSHYDEICSMEPGLNLYISPKDVAMMMALMKIARASGVNATDDCFVDLAGYSACAAEIQEKLKEDEDTYQYFMKKNFGTEAQDTSNCVWANKKEDTSFWQTYASITSYIASSSSKANVNPLDVIDYLTENGHAPTYMTTLLMGDISDFNDVTAYVDDAINVILNGCHKLKKEDKK